MAITRTALPDYSASTVYLYMSPDYQLTSTVESVTPSTDDARIQTVQHLIQLHHRALHAFLMTRVRDPQEAKEVAQEAYVQLLQLDRPDAIGFLRAYLFKTAANIAINRAKQRRVRGALDRLDDPEPPVDWLSPDRHVLGRQQLWLLRRALVELPPNCRRAFILYRFKEWSQEQIANELGVNERMVRHYLVRAGLYCKLRVRGCTPAEAKAQIKEQKVNES